MAQVENTAAIVTQNMQQKINIPESQLEQSGEPVDFKCNNPMPTTKFSLLLLIVPTTVLIETAS